MNLWLVLSTALLVVGVMRLRVTRPLRPGEPGYDELRGIIEVPDRNARSQGIVAVVLGGLALAVALS